MSDRFQTPEEQAKWLRLRSDIYIRDKGICWICNEFVDLKDYDLGHLIDKCNGGQDDYDNLAVMHTKCNLSKPRHTTLEEAMKWKLTPKYLTLRPTIYRPNNKTIIEQTIIKTTKTRKMVTQHSHSELEAIKQLIIEYFNTHPALISNEENQEILEAIKQMASTFNITTKEVRRYLRNANLIKSKYVIQLKDDKYFYIYNHLDELLEKSKSLKASLWDKPRLMGITFYSYKIMLYLAGMSDKIDKEDLLHIARRVKALGIPIRNFHNENTVIKNTLYG